MTMEVQRIKSQLRRAFEGAAWHGPSLQELLTDVTAEMASARPLAGTHTIWEILLHITAWEQAVRRRMEGGPLELPPEEDWPAVKDSSATAWQDAQAALANANRQLREAISQRTDSDLDTIVAGKPYSLYFMLHGIIQHDLYHAGQMALLKKAWRSGAR